MFDAAIDSLSYYRMSLQGLEAVEWLWSVLDSISLYGLYLHYFPEEWEESTASFECVESPYQSDRELEFLRLFEKADFFPMLPIEEYLAETETRITQLPVYPPYHFDSNHLDGLSSGWQFLLVLVQQGADSYSLNHATTGPLMQWLVKVIEYGEVDRQRLKQHCAALQPPLKHLALAIACLEQCTGNDWLDAQLEMGLDGYDWSISTIEALRAEWDEAEVFLADTHSLIDWIESDPKTHMQEVVDLWNSLVDK